MPKMTHTKIEVSRKGKKAIWEVVHNLPDFGLNIMDAFESWALRTRNYTIESFCEYVASKDPSSIICVTKARLDEVIKETT